MFLLLLFHNLDFYRSVFVHLYCFLILLCSLFVKLANCNLFLKIFQIPPPPPSTSDLSVNHSCFRQGRSQKFVKGGLNFFFQGGSSAHVEAWKPPEINRFHWSRHKVDVGTDVENIEIYNSYSEANSDVYNVYFEKV